MVSEIRVPKQYQEHILLLKILVQTVKLIVLIGLSLLLPVKGNRLEFLIVVCANSTFFMYLPLLFYGYSFRPWFYMIDDFGIRVEDKATNSDAVLIKKLSLPLLTNHQLVHSIRRDSWRGFPAIVILVAQEKKKLKQVRLVYGSEDQEEMNTEVLPKLKLMLLKQPANSWPPAPNVGITN